MNVLLLCAFAARAADADPFRPAGALASGTGTLQGESPFLVGDGPSAGVLASFAQGLARRDDEALVQSAVPVELFGAWTLRSQNARFELFAPIYGYVEAPVTDFRGPALGDIRLQANAVVMQSTDRIRASILPRIALPTGTASAVTRRGFEVGLTTAFAGRIDRVGWLANAGLTFSESAELPRVDGVGLGSGADALIGGWWQVTDASPDPEAPAGFRLGAEIDGGVSFVQGARGRNALATGHVFAQNLLASGLGLTVGAGTRLEPGVGAPDYRVFGALTWTHLIRDADGDGLLDPSDACPNVAEDPDGWQDDDGCPDADDDGDGRLDEVDRCPRHAEDVDGWEDADGCPDPDNDADGLADTDDVCPDLPGPAAMRGCPDRDADGVRDADDACPDVPGLPAFQGCADRDGDRVPDPRDACPDTPIPPDADPARSDGCPRIAYVSAGRITITEQVKFETGKAVIRAESHALLDTVAGILTDNPHLRKVEVAGHTDNVGNDASNLRLSQERADAVAAYLGGRGVARSRLTSKGYGESKPADTNRTEAGRTNNRRVEFVITQQDELLTPVPVPEPGPLPAPGPAPDAPFREPEELKNPWADPGAAVPVPAPEPVAPRPVAPAPPPVVPAPAPQPVVPAPQPGPVVPPPQPGPVVPPTEQPEKEKRPPRSSKKR